MYLEVEAHVQCHDDILWNIFLSETLRSHHWTQDQFQLSLSKAQIFWTLLIRISAAAWKRLHSKLNWTIDVCINMYIYDKDFIIRHLMRLLLSSFEFYMSELEFYVRTSYVQICKKEKREPIIQNVLFYICNNILSPTRSFLLCDDRALAVKSHKIFPLSFQSGFFWAVPC